jgi:hypothetical protein
MLRDISYPVAVRALEKWKNNNLEIVERSGDTVHFRFRFNGSTCSNGGTPFKAYLHAVLSSCNVDPRVSKAWIEIPENEIENAEEMCESKRSGDEFLRRLSHFADMEGKAVSDILADELDLNHAGCFCTEPMINQKWRMALSTMYYALCRQKSAGHVEKPAFDIANPPDA